MLGSNTQRQFLLNLGLGGWPRRLASLGLPYLQAQANRIGMLDLARPGGLGNFMVLAQGKNVAQPTLWGFEPSLEAPALAAELPVPLLTTEHLPLLEGRYPKADLEFEVGKLCPPCGGPGRGGG